MIDIKYRVVKEGFFEGIDLRYIHYIFATIDVHIIDHKEINKITVLATHFIKNGKIINNDLNVYLLSENNYLLGYSSVTQLSFLELEKLFKEIKNTVLDLSKGQFFLEDFVTILEDDLNLKYDHISIKK